MGPDRQNTLFYFMCEFLVSQMNQRKLFPRLLATMARTTSSRTNRLDREDVLMHKNITFYVYMMGVHRTTHIVPNRNVLICVQQTAVSLQDKVRTTIAPLRHSKTDTKLQKKNGF